MPHPRFVIPAQAGTHDKHLMTIHFVAGAANPDQRDRNLNPPRRTTYVAMIPRRRSSPNSAISGSPITVK